NQLSTRWSVIDRAHAGSHPAMASARRELLARYGGAVARYLYGAARDAAAAEELFQEFALRFLRGDFRRADPCRGRFRDFLKTALGRLVARHVARHRAAPLPLEIDVADRGAEPADAFEGAFLHSWREELLARAWQALQHLEHESGRPFYRVL